MEMLNTREGKINMTGTWKGIGTKFYGSTDQNEDDSFITTEWIVFLFFPFIPLGSYRVIYGGTDRSIRGSTNHYLILKKLGLQWAQVLFIYFITLATTATAIFLGWYVNNLLVEVEWGIFAAVICTFIPIAACIKLFLEARPSNKRKKNFSHNSINSAPTNRPRTRNSSSHMDMSLINRIDISRIPKPEVFPPETLENPDLEPFNYLIDKYQPLATKILSDRKGELPVWCEVKLALDDTVFANFNSISHFMKYEVCENDSDMIKKANELIKTNNYIAASSAWFVGKEWGSKYPSLRARLSESDKIGINDIPTDALNLLFHSVNFTYYWFAVTFSEYYDSKFGTSVRFQKEGHLKDTYQGMMKGILACFIDGVRS